MDLLVIIVVIAAKDTQEIDQLLIKLVGIWKYSEMTPKESKKEGKK